MTTAVIVRMFMCDHHQNYDGNERINFGLVSAGYLTPPTSSFLSFPFLSVGNDYNLLTGYFWSAA